MSAATVSITANPVAARRRPVVVAGEKKSSIELVAADGAAVATATGGDNRFSVGGKDLSQSIRREMALEVSRDVIQVNKALPTSPSALPPRRTSRKFKTERPRWQTVLIVFTKNSLLLLVFLGLVQMIRRLAILSGDEGNTSPTASSSSAAVSEFKGRIAEMEALLKSSTKMVQEQVEVVDRKVDYEIGGIRREMNKKIEDTGLKFANELKKLDGRTGSSEKSLVELRAQEWLLKEDFATFFDEFMKAKGPDHDDAYDNLDEVRAFARELVKDELEKYAADGLGSVDYALASGGAVVTKHSEPYIVGKGSNWFYKTNWNGVHYDAGKMLRPSFGEPGQCFPLKGSSGFVQIRLRTAIILEAVTLEHVAKSVAYDRSSAPKDCRISGWLQGHDTTDQEKIHHLTEFTYDLDKSNAQTYHVLESAGSNVVDTIRFDFASNHGSPSHTCIYRLRVHGHEPNAASMVSMQS